MPWNCGFRQSWHLLPPSADGDLLDVFLGSHGKTDEEVLLSLPRPRQRSAAKPDAKRYREPRQLFRTIGLLYDVPDGDGRRLIVTALGAAVRRWRPYISEQNALVLGGYAAQALSACQLRTPSPEASGYAEDVRVFPFSFIWRAMLALDGRISSDELNRGVLHAMSSDELQDVVSRIKSSRASGTMSDLFEPIVSINDRLIPWMSWASFGWTLISPKGGSGFYQIRSRLARVVADAASIQRRHQEFATEAEYVEHVSACAALPEDIR